MRSRRCALLALLLTPVSALADPFADFRIPEHRTYRWDASLSGDAYRLGSSQDRYESHSRQGRAAAGTDGYWLRDSDPQRTLLAASAFVDGSRASAESRGPSGGQTVKERSVRESWMVSAAHRRYVWDAPVGLDLGASARGDYGQFWHRGQDRQEGLFGSSPFVDTFGERDESWLYRYQVIATCPVGLGRVRDATPVYDAWAFEERLRSRGVLAGPLSQRTRERLASLLVLRDVEAAVLDRPGRTFWSELTAILSEDQAMEGKVLDAATVLRVLEPYQGAVAVTRGFLPRSPIARLRGSFLALEVQGSHLHFIERQSQDTSYEHTVNDTLYAAFSSSSSTRQAASQDEILFGPHAEFHRPMGLAWQVDASGDILFPTKDPAHGLRVVSSAAAGVLMADRWLARLFVDQIRTIVEDVRVPVVRGADAWQVRFGAKLSWYLEDHVEVVLGVQDEQQSKGPHSFVRQDGVSIGLNYRIAGGVEAPGLIAPARIRP